MRWPHVASAIGVTVAFLGVAFATSVHIGIPIRDPEGTLLGRRMMSPILLMFLFALLDSAARAWRQRRAGDHHGLRELTISIFRERWWWRRLALAVIGFLSFAFTYLAYRNLKSFVSLINYRTYDPELLDLDRWMAFGNDPGPLTHDWLGTGVSAYLLSAIYLAFIPLVPISVAAVLTFTSRMREAYVFVGAMMWCWILGTLSYYAIPSLGPIWGDPALYDDLPYTNVTRVQDALLSHRIDLMADPIGYGGVGSIGGFASLHVGIVFMVVLMMRYYRQRALMWAAIAFLIPTVVATIYFGWHYILDDLAGFVIGWLSVLLGRIMVYPRLLTFWRRRHEREEHGALADRAAA